MKPMKEIWKSIPAEVHNDATANMGANEFWMKHDLEPVRELVKAAFLAGCALKNEETVVLRSKIAELEYGHV